MIWLVYSRIVRILHELRLENRIVRGIGGDHSIRRVNTFLFSKLSKPATKAEEEEASGKGCDI